MVIHPFSNTDVDTIYSIVALPNSYEDTIHYSAGLIGWWVATIRSRFALCQLSTHGFLGSTFLIKG